ncbi:hybrid sensor histidine kinase/response regulator [Cohnella silvisoli]|uniref:histidine kinase n=1 Tax=Cohnella silvisoli TaxID=2873699 RepID=A0ABV1KV20_9BACL|nr:ATP-binding protein [Cohnella silvisoli]MCD9023346.1 response regulator [Cohnella silvisoli]
MKSTKNKTALKHMMMVILFLSFLLGMRWLWAEVFATPEHPRAIQGVLDLRGWNFEKSPSISLKGEWEFYPAAFISHEDIMRQSNDNRHYVHVPGDWRSGMSKDSDSSFGYGTYRLRILIDPRENQSYQFWIQEIQASSIVEINGETAAVSGMPAEREEAYKPRKASYVASYKADGAKEIELLVRTANFADPFNGGIVKPIRFGSEAAVDAERGNSINFQLVTFFILMMHGLYACILYLFNLRQKAFLIFFLLLLTASLSVVSSNDNLLLQWFSFGYTLDLKIRLLSYEWLSFFMLLLTRTFSEHVVGVKLFRTYTAVLVLYSGFVLAATAPLIYYSMEIRAFSLLYLFPLAWSIYLIAKMVARKQRDTIFLLLAATSILSSVFWGSISSYQNISRIYYPIDVIAAIVGFSAYWFKRYFRNSEENAMLNEQLRRSDKLKDQFLANTSHELRTPLHGIMNIAQNIAAKEKHAMDVKSSEDMELLITISRRMSHTLNDLLDVVRLKEQRIVLQKKPVSIPSVVTGVFDMLKFMAEGKPVMLIKDMEESMTPVMADEKRLVQILFNLLHNALKYTDEGNITVTAEIENGQALLIHVSDTGAGMDKETQERVFTPYEQGPHGMSDGGGIGLGLSICKQLVELHGGQITVRSEAGKGSIFTLFLPLTDSPILPVLQDFPYQRFEGKEEAAASRMLADAADNAWPSPQLALPPFGDGRANILAVDDDPVNLKVLVDILEADPYIVKSVTSAREALELLGTEQWDLLIVDVMMPHMSGYELTQRVRERFSVSELPILLLTARSEPADTYAGFISGANDYVTKPIDALELKYRIWSLTTLRQSVNERMRMEAAYLQAQIHPHFLFNTLNSIMALSDLDLGRMRKLGDAFTSYLRISFDFLNAGRLVALSHELDLVRAYLYIEKERFEDRLSVVWEVDPNMLGVLLPPLTIQPLVENAVRHGVLSRVKGGTVRIRIRRQELFALIEVTDDGKGMKQEKVQQVLGQARKGKEGIGLSNTHRRLTQMYGNGLSIHSKEGEGTILSFVIPLTDVE